MASNNAAEEVLRSARASQRMSTSSRPDPRKFTLNREAAKRIRDSALASSLSQWLTEELGRPVRGAQDAAELAEDLESGVVFCELAAKLFGQITRYRDPPANEFQRMENFELFSRAMARFGLASQRPPSKRGADFALYVPCLLELATLSREHAQRMEMASAVPEELVVEGQQQQQQQQDKSVVRIDNLEEEVARAEQEEEDQAAEDMNQLLGQLHLERMQRQRAGPPKLRLVDVGGRQLVCIERAGESMGSVVWPGSLALVSYLHTGPFRQRLLSASSASPSGTVLELGSGCGLCGVWCASEGLDVVVTDLPQCVDLLWANVAANAQQVVKGGGSCSARALDFADGAQVRKLLGHLDRPLTVLASDVVYGDAIRPLVACLRVLFEVVPDATVILAYKQRDAQLEDGFFLDIGQDNYKEVASSSSNTDECRIFEIRGIAPLL